MLSYSHVVTYGTANQTWLADLSDLQVVAVGGQNLLIAANQWRGTGVSSYSFASADLPLSPAGSRAYLDSFAYQGEPKLALVTVDSQTRVSLTNLAGADGKGISVAADGQLGSFAPLLGDIGPKIAVLGQFQLGNDSFLYSARKGELGFTVHKLGANGSLSQVADVTIPGSGYAAGASLDRIVELSSGGQKFLVAISGLGDFVSTHPVLAGGVIGAGSLHSGLMGAGYAVPTQIAAVETGGRSFVLLGASSSSSLTVFQLMPDGSLKNTDHILDEGTTRFQSITALQAVTLNGRAYVFAGGVDDGISVFTLQPDGRLLHLQTIVDSNDMTLSDVIDIEARVIGGKIALFVASATEAGITQLSFDPGNLGTTGLAPIGAARGTAQDDLILAQSGTTSISGGDGDDILIATTQDITMWGGAGADIFVPANLSGRVTIRDFEFGTDRLDFSQLGMVRSTWQLTFSPQADGVKIYYHGAVLEIHTKDGRGLTSEKFTNGDPFTIAHYDLPPLDPAQVGAEAVPATVRKYLFGGADADSLIGGEGADSIMAGAGNDTVSGMSGDDTLRGEDGHDRLRGQGGDDLIHGDAGKDSLFGDNGNDRIFGGSGADMIWGDAGDDLLSGDDDDRLWGGLGNDRLWGGRGHDILLSEGGRDTLDGSDGNDSLRGGDADDRLFGGAGADSLYGDAGNDILYG